jgi:hypothetical protein
MTRPDPNGNASSGGRAREAARTAATPCRLRHELVGRFDDLPPTVVPAVLAGPVHHLGVAAVVALHELGRLQLVVVGGAALTGAGLRMSSLRYGHGLVPVDGNAETRAWSGPGGATHSVEDSPMSTQRTLIRWGRETGCSRSNGHFARNLPAPPIRPAVQTRDASGRLVVAQLLELAPARVDGRLVVLLFVVGSAERPVDRLVLGPGRDLALREGQK